MRAQCFPVSGTWTGNCPTRRGFRWSRSGRSATISRRGCGASWLSWPRSRSRSGASRAGGLSAGPGGGAAPLYEHRVTPPAVVAADPFADADGAESGAGVQAQAGGVLGEDAGLYGPDAGLVGGGGEGGEQRRADPAPVAAWVDVHTVLDDAGID